MSRKRYTKKEAQTKASVLPTQSLPRTVVRKDSPAHRMDMADRVIIDTMDTQCSACQQTAAKFVCSCAFPPLPVCSGCIATHLETEGRHAPAPIQQQPAPKAPAPGQGNEVCDRCRSKSAICFCLCSAPLRKYCKDCDDEHYKQNQLLNHSKHPMSCYLVVASGKVPLETFKRKQQFINDVQLRLGQELVTFDAFVGEVEQKFDALTALVVGQKETLLKDLQAQKAKLMWLLSHAHQEIDRKRYEGAFEVVTEFDDIILNGYLEATSPEIKLFTGTANLEKVIELLEKSVTYQVATDINFIFPQQIPVIQGNILKLYDPKTLEKTQITLTQTPRIDNATAYCYIKADTLLCCGGTNHNEVYEINVRTQTVASVTKMNAIRGYTGIWKYKNDSVYVFGGYDNTGCCLITSEKYLLSAKTWSNLRNQLSKGKYLCSVCEHSSSIYVSGVSLQYYGDAYYGRTQQPVRAAETAGSSIEHFDPQNETFALLRTDNVSIASIICSDGENLYSIRQGAIEQATFTNGPTAATFAVKANVPALGNGRYWLRFPMKWFGELTSVVTSSENPTGLFRFSPTKSEFKLVVDFAL